MRHRTRVWSVGLLMTSLCACGAKISSIGDETPPSGAKGGSGAGGSFGAPPSFNTTPPIPPCTDEPCSDFPARPIIDEGAPADAATMFADHPATGAAPCLTEPEDGTLFPQQWLRPRIRWTGATKGLHRITIQSDREKNPLVVYTVNSFWTVPKEIWLALSLHVVDRDITVTVRAAGGGESSARFGIAPVSASGSMVFWATKPDQVGRDVSATDEDYDSELRGFSVGEESTVPVLRIRQVMQPSRDQAGVKRRVRCIGCHTATPDAGFVAFVDDWPWNLAIAGVDPTNVGQPLPNLGQGGLAALNLPWGGMMSFSRAYWGAGRRLVVVASSLQNYAALWSQDNAMPGKLVWYNLDAPAPGMVMPGVQVGVIARDGDLRGAASPSWSHDGRRIVYASTMGGNLDGALELGATDLYSVPFNDGAGGTAAALKGAADASFEEYYPAFSPDDSLVAFTRVPRGERMAANQHAEIAVVAAAGGEALRLVANDPPACTGKKSPGVANHWPKWAPIVQEARGKKYYWLLFSSNRADIAPVMRKYGDGTAQDPNVYVTQLYMSVVVEDEGGLHSYPAVYLWNQPADTVNLTPVWEHLSIPKVIQ